MDFSKNFGERGARLHNVISTYTPRGLEKLRKQVEELLNKLRTRNNNSFAFFFPPTQPVRHLSFNITNGTITSADWKVFADAFPGSETRAGTLANVTLLLIPKDLADDDDESDDDGQSGAAALLPNTKTRRGRLYLELCIYIVALIAVLVTFAYFYLDRPALSTDWIPLMWG